MALLPVFLVQHVHVFSAHMHTRTCMMYVEVEPWMHDACSNYVLSVDVGNVAVGALLNKRLGK